MFSSNSVVEVTILPGSSGFFKLGYQNKMPPKEIAT
jgi:hypothetical protein